MSFISLFLILVLALSAVVLFLTEPTKSEKRVRERLGAGHGSLGDRPRECAAPGGRRDRRVAAAALDPL